MTSMSMERSAWISCVFSCGCRRQSVDSTIFACAAFATPCKGKREREKLNHRTTGTGETSGSRGPTGKHVGAAQRYQGHPIGQIPLSPGIGLDRLQNAHLLVLEPAHAVAADHAVDV